MNIQCVYKIVNIVNQHQYIGSTINFDRRKKRHTRELTNKKHHSRHLQNAWDFYGFDKFEFHILEIVNDINELTNRETFYLQSLNPEYNTMRDIKSHIGLKRSLETRKKMSLAQVGKKHSEETKQKLREINTGKKQSEETKQKRVSSMKSSEKFNVAVRSKDRSDKIKASRLNNGGYIITEEQKQKARDTLKLKNLPSPNNIKIQKYDLNGNFICEYPSFQKAEKDNMLWRGSLSKHINNLQKSEYKNYIWKIYEY
jgi:group I intron endonuclease